MLPSNVPPTLQGVRIALTTAADDPHSPASYLRELEGEVIFYPVAQVLPPAHYNELDDALHRCARGEINWLLLTTPCAVQAVAERLAHLGLATTDLGAVRVAVYGAQTRQVLAALLPGWESMLPHTTTHPQLVDAMQLSPGDTVLAPLALRSRADWPDLLRAVQVEVIAAPAYRLLIGQGGDDLPGLLWGGFIDIIVFLTENSVRHFVTRLKADGGSLAMLDHVPVACLDPQTAAAAKAYALNVKVAPSTYTSGALVSALAEHFKAKVIES